METRKSGHSIKVWRYELLISYENTQNYITRVSVQYGRILHKCQGCIFTSPKDKCNIPYCKETSVIILYSYLQHQKLDLRQPSNSPHFGMHMLQRCITLQWYTQAKSSIKH